MKPDIHPASKDVTVTCSCGCVFTISTTLGHDLPIEVCSKCHSFYTGQQKITTSGRVERFLGKYKKKTIADAVGDAKK